MTGHPALQRALIKWSATHPESYKAVVWSLCSAAEALLRPGVAGERQALFLRFDRILRGGEENSRESRKP